MMNCQNKVAIIYRDNILAHCCAAITKKHLLTLRPDVLTINMINMPIKEHDIPDVYEVAESHSTIYIMGFTPTEKDFGALTKQAEVVWFDNHRSKIQALPDKYFGIPGIRKFSPGLAGTVWKFFFEEKKLPSCVAYIDDYLRDTASERANNYWHGMRLMETDPTISQDFWEALFEIRENLPDSASEDEIMERMKWDAMLQVVNMGAIAHTFNVIETEMMCNYAVLTDTCAFINARTVDVNTLKSRFPTHKYVGWYYSLGACLNDDPNCTLYKYHVKANAPNADAAKYASEYGGCGNHKTASFTTDKLPRRLKG